MFHYYNRLVSDKTSLHFTSTHGQSTRRQSIFLIVQRLYYILHKNLTLAISNTQQQDNSPTNQLAVSQVADWSTHGLVNS